MFRADDAASFKASARAAAERKLRGVDQALDIDASPPKVPVKAK